MKKKLREDTNFSDWIIGFPFLQKQYTCRRAGVVKESVIPPKIDNRFIFNYLELTETFLKSHPQPNESVWIFKTIPENDANRLLYKATERDRRPIAESLRQVRDCRLISCIVLRKINSNNINIKIWVRPNNTYKLIQDLWTKNSQNSTLECIDYKALNSMWPVFKV